MASFTTLSFIILLSSFLLSSLSYAQTLPKPPSFNFPIKKDPSTNQYYSTIQIGSNATTLDVVIDLGGKFLYFNSNDYIKATLSYRPILCGTQQCQIAYGVGCINNTCSDYALNPFTGGQGYSGLGQDILHVQSTSGERYTMNNFIFQISDPVLRKGLAGRAVGLMGLGRTSVSLQAQIASSFETAQKFTLCVPSAGGGTDGILIVGETAYSNPFEEMSNSPLTTPLIRNPVSTSGNGVIGNLTNEYFIDVKSVRVGSKTLSFNKTLLSINKKDGSGGTSIWTVRPYTSLHISIHRALVNEFVKAAASQNIKRVDNVAPFGACFDSKTVASSKTGPNVPTIDLVLQNENVYWRFYGSNSMVRIINKDVICLAFVEGEINTKGPTTSIVVGGYQMENYLLVFDVASSMLGLSSSLLLHDASCSKLGAN